MSDDVRGVPETLRTLQRMQARFADLHETDAQGAQLVATRARVQAPKRSGRLASSIGVFGGDGAALVGSHLIYAGVIHAGYPRRNIRANPYLTRAVDQSGESVQDIYERRADAICAEVAR